MVKPLVGGEDDGSVRGPQWPRGRPEQCGAKEWGLDEGGGAHRVTQSKRVSCHCAQSWWGEGAWQEATCQALGQLLLQGQFGLEETGRGATVRSKRRTHMALYLDTLLQQSNMQNTSEQITCCSFQLKMSKILICSQVSKLA